MKVAVHLRGGPNLTNIRSEVIADGLYECGHHVKYLPRGEASKDADLVVQTGFSNTTAFKGAIDRGVPYLVMEAPPFRTMHPWETHSSWGYNGLAGGAYRPEAPHEDRAHPQQQERKEEGKTLIIGQKPTDHSLRGSDHISWLVAKLEEYPDAELRHHPLMVRAQSSIEEALEDVSKVITYTSTVAVDGRFAGCEVVIEGRGSWGELSTHDLSWCSFANDEYRSEGVARHILSGYEEARHRAEQGLVEIPRGKQDGRAICEQYHQRVIR